MNRLPQRASPSIARKRAIVGAAFRSAFPAAFFAAVIAALFSSRADARPRFPEYPLTTTAASYAGGGALRPSGPGSIFDNPAALSVDDQVQAEAGLLGLASGLSPYGLVGGATANHAAYAAGYFYDARAGDPDHPNPPRQGMIAGAAWEIAPWIQAGASVRSDGTGAGIGFNGFGIDENLGLLLAPAEGLRFGFAARNLQESGVGQKPAGYTSPRSYSLSAAAGETKLHLPGLTLREPDLSYELRATGTPPLSFVNIFSAGSRFTPDGRLGLRGTYLMPVDEAPGYAVGAFLEFPLGPSSLTFSYTFQSGLSDQSGEPGASHSISLSFRIGNKPDPIPPQVEVRADRVLLAPGDSGVSEVFFRLAASDKSAAAAAGNATGDIVNAGGIKEWDLEIRSVGEGGLAADEVRDFKGKDLPPRVIRWSADDAEGRRVAPGFYAFRFTARDLSGNLAATAWQLLEIASAPALSGN